MKGAGHHNKLPHTPIAQSVEQLTFNQRVVGSSPTGGTERGGPPDSNYLEIQDSLRIDLIFPVTYGKVSLWKNEM